MKKYNAWMVLFLLVIGNGCACALTLKAAIGVGAWDAMAQTISILSTIKVGTIGMIFNCSCVLGEYLLLREQFTVRHFLQVIVSILFGFVVNFMLYNIFTFGISDYYVRVIVLVIAYILMAIFVGGIMSLNIITFALEGFCMELSQQFHWEFSKVRQSVDVVCILLSIAICLIANIPWIIREGTIIGMLLYSPVLKIAMMYETKLFKKLKIIDE